MLELPEAVTAAKQLNSAVKGRAVRLARANASPHRFAFYTGEPEGYSALLEGRAIDGAASAGGQVELSLGELCLMLNDGASPRYFAPGVPRPKKHQLLLELDDGAAIACTVRTYGGIHLFRAGGERRFLRSYGAGNAVAPLGCVRRALFYVAARGAEAVGERQGVPRHRAADPRAGQRRPPGYPVPGGRRLNSLSEEAFAALFGSVKNTLARMAGQGGRDVEKDLYGRPGGYRTLLSARTAAGPCPRCGGGLVRRAYLGGNVYFCPHCQPLE